MNWVGYDIYINKSILMVIFSVKESLANFHISKLNSLKQVIHTRELNFNPKNFNLEINHNNMILFFSYE